MRVYVPFGSEWFPYFMRRLGERPANVGFVLESACWARRNRSSSHGLLRYHHVSAQRSDQRIAARGTLVDDRRIPRAVKAGAAGPNSTDGMPAAPRSRRRSRTSCRRSDARAAGRCRGVGRAAPAADCAGSISYGVATEDQLRLGLELGIVGASARPGCACDFDAARRRTARPAACAARTAAWHGPDSCSTRGRRR